MSSDRFIVWDGVSQSNLDELPDAAPLDEQVNNSDTPMPTQTIDDEQTLLNSFKHALDKHTRSATFTCGGTLPILLTPGRLQQGELTPILNERFGGERLLARSVSLRWGQDKAGRVLTLPAVNAEEQISVEQLVADCQPATFGRGGKDVYDESYRKAGALGIDE
jgi:hypothetical protein